MVGYPGQPIVRVFLGCFLLEQLDNNIFAYENCFYFHSRFNGCLGLLHARIPRTGNRQGILGCCLLEQSTCNRKSLYLKTVSNGV